MFINTQNNISAFNVSNPICDTNALSVDTCSSSESITEADILQTDDDFLRQRKFNVWNGQVNIPQFSFIPNFSNRNISTADNVCKIRRISLTPNCPNLHFQREEDSLTALIVRPQQNSWLQIIFNTLDEYQAWLGWAIGKGIIVGTIIFVHIPTCQQSYQLLRGTKKLVDLSVSTISQQVLHTVKSVSILAVIGLESAYSSTHPAILCCNFLTKASSLLLLPWAVYKATYNISSITSRVRAICNKEKTRVETACSEQNHNPAATYLENIECYEEHYSPHVKKATLITAANMSSIVEALVGGATTGTKAVNLYTALVSYLRQPFATEVVRAKNDITEDDFTLFHALTCELTKTEMREIIKELGSGSFLSWQCNHAKYSDQHEIGFLTAILSCYIVAYAIKEKLEFHLLPCELVKFITASISGIYKQNKKPTKIEMLKNSKLEININAMLQKIYSCRKLDGCWWNKLRGLGLPFGGSVNNVYAKIILPILALHSLIILSKSNIVK